MMEYAVGHKKLKERNKKYKECICGALLNVVAKKCQECNHIFYVAQKKPRISKYFQEIKWYEVNQGDIIYLESNDYWIDKKTNNMILMGEQGEFKVMKIAESGLLLYNNFVGFTFQQMIEEGYNPKTHITRNKAGIYKKKFSSSEEPTLKKIKTKKKSNKKTKK